MDLKWSSIGWHHYYTWITASLPQRVYIGSSAILTYLRGILNGWDCGEIVERRWGWSSRSATILAGTLTQRMGDG